jgi:hypothetical protein
MSNELFINFMREKGLEPNQIDLKNFGFMARSLMQDEIERLEEMVDNAHSALEAVKMSGACKDEELKFIELGFDNKPQALKEGK